jgi:flagellar basal body-associated protein FliL
MEKYTNYCLYKLTQELYVGKEYEKYVNQLSKENDDDEINKESNSTSIVIVIILIVVIFIVVITLFVIRMYKRKHMKKIGGDENNQNYQKPDGTINKDEIQIEIKHQPLDENDKI